MVGIHGLFSVAYCQKTEHIIEYTVWILQNVNVCHRPELWCIMLLKIHIRFIFSRDMTYIISYDSYQNYYDFYQ